jgi:hypothetical protein
MLLNCLNVKVPLRVITLTGMDLVQALYWDGGDYLVVLGIGARTRESFHLQCLIFRRYRNPSPRSIYTDWNQVNSPKGCRVFASSWFPLPILSHQVQYNFRSTVEKVGARFADSFKGSSKEKFTCLVEPYYATMLEGLKPSWQAMRALKSPDLN